MYLSKGSNGKYYLYFRNSKSKINRINTETDNKEEAEIFKANFVPPGKHKIAFLRAPVFPTTEFQPILLKTAIDDFMNIVSDELEKGSVYLYKLSFQRLLKVVGNKYVHLIVPSDIERFKVFNRKTASKITVDCHLRNLSCFFRKLKGSKKLSDNPMDQINFYDEPAVERRCFTFEDIERIKTLITHPTHMRIFIFALNSGARLNEILLLQFKDISFINKTIAIQNKPELDYKTKSGRKRILPLTPILAEAIGEQSLNLNSFVFENGKGYHFDKSHISFSFKKYFRKAGFPDNRFHDTRHTVATRMLEQGIPITHVQKLLGHSDIKVTMGYCHTDITSLSISLNKFQYLPGEKKDDVA